MTRKILLLLLIFLLSCGKKGTPNPVDRFGPLLDKIKVIDANHIDLKFSEELDTNLLSVNNFTILKPNQETLKIFGVYSIFSNSEIILATEKQDTVIYSLSGSVQDRGGNIGEFEEDFKGSIMPDTIAPQVMEYSPELKSRELFLRFSEAIETTSLRYFIIPKPKEGFNLYWDKGWRQVDFRPATEGDTFVNKNLYYFLLLQAMDFNHNRSRRLCFFFTPDTVRPGFNIKGKVYLEDSLVSGALIVCRKRGKIVALSISELGRFSFPVKDDTIYEVEAYYKRSGARVRAEVKREIEMKLSEKELLPDEDIFQ